MRNTGTLQGFTLFNGRTGGDNVEDCNNRGGGIYSLADVFAARVTGCVISNNISVRGGGAHSGYLENCLFTENLAFNNSSALRNGIARQCYFTRNLGSQVIGFPSQIINCTVAYNTAQTGFWGGSVPTPFRIYNTLFDSSKVDGVMLYSCAYLPTCQLNNSPSTNAYTGNLLLDANGIPTYGSVAIDNANTNFYADYPATDIAGNQRIYNAKLDIGCYECDWRPRYASDLDSQGIQVTAADPLTVETNDAAFVRGSAVSLPRGALEIAWPKTYSQSYIARYAVTGTGTLSVYRDNVLVDTATYASGWIKNKFQYSGSQMTMRFVYTPGANDTGSALLDAFALGSSTLMLLK